MKKNKIYETKDLYLASYLTAIGFVLSNSSNHNSEIYFEFERSDRLEDESLRFISRQALVEPVAFSQAMRSLKSILYAIKNEDGNNYNNANRRK